MCVQREKYRLLSILLLHIEPCLQIKCYVMNLVFSLLVLMDEITPTSIYEIVVISSINTEFWNTEKKRI